MPKKSYFKTARNKQLFKNLQLVAEQLGYTVILRRVKLMEPTHVGLTCPDLNKIYIDPRGNSDIISTLAHEIGHIILMTLKPPGHETTEDNDFNNRIGENAADLIGEAILSAVGYKSDYTDIFTKATEQLKYAQSQYKNKKTLAAFVHGYCIALSDILPNSIGSKTFLKQAREIINGTKDQLNKAGKYGN